jgi:hypothetical protein
MWLRVTMKDRPLMINGDRVLKITEIPGGAKDHRGCHVYVSLTDYIEVDQSLHEMMISLGFEERT